MCLCLNRVCAQVRSFSIHSNLARTAAAAVTGIKWTAWHQHSSIQEKQNPRQAHTSDGFSSCCSTNMSLRLQLCMGWSPVTCWSGMDNWVHDSPGHSPKQSRTALSPQTSSCYPGGLQLSHRAVCCSPRPVCTCPRARGSSPTPPSSSPASAQEILQQPLIGCLVV